MCASVNAMLVLSSPNNKSRSQTLAEAVVALGSVADVSLFNLGNYQATAVAQPHNAAYASFTSGSTGKPKAVVVERSAYCSNILAHSSALQFSKNPRVLQSASYAFVRKQIWKVDVFIQLEPLIAWLYNCQYIL